MDETRAFGLFIDGLRIEKSMSREELCDEIMSLSQYKRYLRGDTSIPNSKLVMIADRLKYSITELHTLFRIKHNNEYSHILSIYNLIKSNKYNEAYEKISKMRNEIIVSEYNNLFFDYCFLKVQHSLKMVSDIHVLGLYSKLIDYPKCTEKTSFNMVEITTLIEIVKISAGLDNNEPSEIMYRFLTSRDFQYISSSDSAFLPSIYSSLASLFGAQEEYKKAIEISQRGIEYCIHHESLNALSHLYFFNGLAYHYINETQKGNESIKKCFMLLHIENKIEKFTQFKNIFESKLKINLSDIIDL